MSDGLGFLNDVAARPAVDPTVADRVRASQPSGPEPGAKSQAGEPFDPAKHEPRQTADGHWRAKRGGGAASADQAGRNEEAIRLSLPPEDPDSHGMPGPGDDGAGRDEALERRSAAAALTQAGCALTMWALGPEAEPTQADAKQLVQAHEVWLARTGMKVDNPHVALAMAWAGYWSVSLERHETARGRLRGLLGKLAFWKRKGKKR